jgi:hypothetical protein
LMSSELSFLFLKDEGTGRKRLTFLVDEGSPPTQALKLRRRSSGKATSIIVCIALLFCPVIRS